MPQTKDLILRKATMDDWKDMFHNIWSQPQSAKYMVWNITTTETDAIARMERTIAYQAAHEYHWTVVEKASMQAIGWVGMEEHSKGVWGETGIAIGPDFTGKGYGKQLLNFLADYARENLGAKRFVACCRKENEASKGTIRSCGFTYTHSEEVMHPRDHVLYTLDHYEKALCKLRTFLPEDKEQILDTLTDKSVAKTYMLPDFASRNEATALFDRLAALSQDDGRYVRCIDAGGKAIGFLNDVEINSGKIELGYVIHPSFQGQGYMAEALTIAIKELLAEKFSTVLCGAFEENTASVRVMERCGMQRLAETESIEYRGKTHTCVYYAANKEK